MAKVRRIPLLIILMLCIGINAVMAQDCPSIVERALQAADNACSAIGRNQACYGNIHLDAVVRPDGGDVQFEKPGDILDLVRINSLHLSPLDESNSEWGVALLKVQANLPDTLPGQNVTMLMFGDVQLTEAEVVGDSSTTPLQAFYFQSGIADTGCLEAPNGILLQSPPGGPAATLNINGASVSFGSTVFVQAPSGGGQMTVSTLAGMAQVQSMGQAKTIVQGAQTSLQLDTAGNASSVPSQPVPVVDGLLEPLMSNVNGTHLMTPTYEDAAANTTIQNLTSQNVLTPLSPEQPVQAASQEVIELTEDDLPPIPSSNTTITPVKCSTCITVPPRPTQDPDEVPESRLDLIAGIWTRKYGETTQSGDCSGYDAGDNGGPDHDYGPDDPSTQAQMCVWYTGGVVFLDNQTYRWSGTGIPLNTYTTDISIDSYDNSSHQKIMTVIDEGNVDVAYTSTTGTCTVTTVIHYTLYIPGSPFGCRANSVQITPGDDNATPDPISTPVPEEVIVDPVIAGQYTMTWLPFDQYCDADYAPTFTEAMVKPRSFDSISLEVDGGGYLLNGDGLRGEFSDYGDSLNITLTRRFNDDFNVTWQQGNENYSKSCSAQGVLKLATADAEQPVFTPPVNSSGNNTSDTSNSGDSSSQPVGEATPPTPGTYSATWSPMAGLECPEAMKPLLPNFSQAVITTTSDTSFTLDSGTDTYQVDLVPYGAQWMYMAFNNDNSGVTMNFIDIQDGQLTGSYTYFAADGSFCIMTLELKK